MTAFLKNRYTLIGLTTGLALSVYAAPSPAQLDVTGGEATINNAEIFVPDAGGVVNNGTGPDTRAVVTGGQFNNVTIETNQGSIPADAVFRANTLPTISGADGVNNLAGFNGLNGQVLGTLSFRSVGPLGARFFNIPTTLQFQVDTATSAALVGAGVQTEYRAEGFILQETGFVVGASGVGAVQRRTPVTLVQYQPGAPGATPPVDTTVLGTPVSGAAYTADRPGDAFTSANFDLDFNGGVVLTPPGFTLGTPQDGGAQTADIIFRRFQSGTSQVTAISIFNQVALVNLPDFDDIIFDDDADGIPNEDDDDSTGGNPGAGNPGNDQDVGNAGESPNGDDFGSGSQGQGDVNGNAGGDDDDGTTADDGTDDGGLIGALPDTDDGTTDDDGVADDGDDGTDDVADSGNDDSDDDDDDGDDDGDDDDNDDDDGGVVTHPNDGGDQFSPILPRFVFIGIFVFTNVPSGRWVDPPMADGFEYEMTARDVPVGTPSRVFPGMTGVGQADDSVFTRISGFPIDVDADDTFVVSVDGIVLGEFSPGDTLRFSDYADALGDRLVDGGVRKFTISEINPAVNTRDPIAFPLQLDFNTNTASFEMRALEADPNGETTRISSATQ
jgi:hypothetical protein